MERSRRIIAASMALVLILATGGCGGNSADNTAIASSIAASPTGAPAVLPTTSGTGSPTSSPTSAPLSGSLTVFAAASLTDAFTEIGNRLTAENPGLRISFNFAGSQALVTQLQQGARADVFASADLKQMTAAQGANLIDGNPIVFTHNRLTIIVPASNPGGINAPVDLARPGLKLVIANKDVPAGRYTRQSLDLMSADPAFGADFRARVEANVVSEENNVKQVVTKVQLGEADAGIVYASDVTAAVQGDVATIGIPDSMNVIAEYPIARVAGGNAALGQAFIDAVLSAAGQQTLQAHGFH
ncbi:MAG TPA: molybdate ABC transporter substrate-binding protein [Thermomicrobiales bacterium]|nr:molybdate ABC transporter substrate-binding protein [Thermomicrobiales bacterium]HRA30999.1 molybdate ABC transporter substrate-binding protein [Thermomicrobiales bacterium]